MIRQDKSPQRMLTPEELKKRVRWIEYKDHKILLTDLSNIGEEEDMISLMSKTIDTVRENPGSLVLIDYHNAKITAKLMKEVKKYGSGEKKKLKTRTALIGVKGLNNIFINSYFMVTKDEGTRNFSSEEEAKEWLISRD